MAELTSLDFYDRPSRSSYAIFLSIMMIIALIIIIGIILLLVSRYNKPCTGAPVAPTNVEVSYIDLSTFQVRWKIIPDVALYTVYVSKNKDFTRVQSEKTTYANTSAANITGLTLNKTYYIFVTASNACGESINSDLMQFVFIAS